jgi:ABC-type phosphate transport system ATPase subunit
MEPVRLSLKSNGEWRKSSSLEFQLASLFLSGGESKALAIGRILVARSKLLTVDEISACLSLITAREMCVNYPQIREGGGNKDGDIKQYFDIGFKNT